MTLMYLTGVQGTLLSIPELD